MKKIIVFAVMLLPALPSFITGIRSQMQTTEENRDAMLNQRFEQWCYNEGYDYYGMTENESESLWCDVWMECEDYESAVDSIDNVLGLSNMLNQAM